MNEHVTALAAAEGLGFDLDSYTVVNTFDAHRLTHLAKVHGLGAELHERLLRAQLVEGRSSMRRPPSSGWASRSGCPRRVPGTCSPGTTMPPRFATQRAPDYRGSPGRKWCAAARSRTGRT